MEHNLTINFLLVRVPVLSVTICLTCPKLAKDSEFIISTLSFLSLLIFSSHLANSDNI